MRTPALGILVFCLAAESTVNASPQGRFAFSSRPEPLVIERVPDQPGLALRLARQAAAARLQSSAAADRLRNDAVLVDASTFAFAIPAAGSLQGGGGTFFRSDVTLANYGDGPQDVMVLWLERGQDGTNAPTFRLTLPDGPPVTTRDFVAALGRSGLGTLYFLAIDSSGQVDPAGNIDGFSRIWTNQPGAAGTVSQPFTGMDDFNLYDEFEAIALGLRQDADYRTNAGVVNLDGVAHTFQVTVFGETSFAEFTITVPAMSMQQVAIPAGSWGAVTLTFTPEVDEVDFGWLAYGTSVDNRTGDGWVSNAARISDPE